MKRIQHETGGIALSKKWVVLAGIVCLSLSAGWTGGGFASDDDITPEQVVAEHLKTLGSPAALAQLKTVAFVGTTSVDFVQGMYGSMSGTSMVVSDGEKLGIVLKYGDYNNYPGEYLAFDGNEVSVGHINPGQRSPLADFVYRYNGIMKEGLLGGVLSGGWPLRHLEAKEPKLKYHQTTIDGRPLHEIEYRPKQGLRDMKVKLYFDLETYRHVRTEYRVRIRDDMSAAPGGAGTRSGRFQSPDAGGVDGFAILSQGLPDSIYVLIEKFDDFKKVGAIEFPHTYSIDYSLEGQGRTFVGKWTMNAQQWAFNRDYDNKIFIAQK
jgi:hypothetical protein